MLYIKACTQQANPGEMSGSALWWYFLKCNQQMAVKLQLALMYPKPMRWYAF